jgi:hypothetical protein
MALPPGPAQVYLGSQRANIFQEAWFARTPANGEIRIALGSFDSLRGVRQILGRTPILAGTYQESYEVIIENMLPGAVTAEVEELPPVALAWDVTRASHPYEIDGRKLKFQPRLDGRERTRITYTLRMRELQH